MKLKTYHAYTMAEALAAVKRDLGNAAVILRTRTFKRGGFLGIGRKTIVEVTATVGEDSESKKKSASTSPNPRSSAEIGARRAYSSSQAQIPPNAESSTANEATRHAPDEFQPVTDEDRERTRQLARILAERYEKQERERAARSGVIDDDVELDRQLAQLSQSWADEEEESDSKRLSLTQPPTDGNSDEQPEPAIVGSEEQKANLRSSSESSRRFILTPDSTDHEVQPQKARTSPPRLPETDTPARNGHPNDRVDGDASRKEIPAQRLPVQPVQLFAEDQRDHNRSDNARAMQEELAAIREMVGQVLQRQSSPAGNIGVNSAALPQQLFEMYLKLIGQDISEELADRIINDVRDELGQADLDDEEKVREAMLRNLIDYIPTAQQAVAQHSPDSRPLTIALVGPTGVGKTTTLAKLAASFKLRHNRKVGLITCDTYRIAAVDQLRTYANIIGLPIKVALTPREMQQCVYALSDCDVILIDTAGRSQNDTDRLAELQQFIEAANPHEVHLVLSGTASEKVLLREAEAFSQVGVDKVVLTKLDEAVSFGMLVNVIRQVGKELSFFTTGQEVPDHLEIGRPERLAELILGGKVHE